MIYRQVRGLRGRSRLAVGSDCLLSGRLQQLAVIWTRLASGYGIRVARRGQGVLNDFAIWLPACLQFAVHVVDGAQVKRLNDISNLEETPEFRLALDCISPAGFWLRLSVALSLSWTPNCCCCQLFCTAAARGLRLSMPAGCHLPLAACRSPVARIQAYSLQHGCRLGSASVCIDFHWFVSCANQFVVWLVKFERFSFKLSA